MFIVNYFNFDQTKYNIVYNNQLNMNNMNINSCLN